MVHRDGRPSTTHHLTVDSTLLCRPAGLRSPHEVRQPLDTTRPLLGSRAASLAQPPVVLRP